jgi:hypothetical protein
MFVAKHLPIALQTLVTIIDSAQLIQAAKLLRDAGTDIVAVYSSGGALAGTITKTDVGGQISRCQSRSCAIPASSVTKLSSANQSIS